MSLLFKLKAMFTSIHGSNTAFYLALGVLDNANKTSKQYTYTLLFLLVRLDGLLKDLVQIFRVPRG